MSYVVDDAGDKYRGGYASSGFNPDEVRVQSSTFENYVGGTVLLVFVIFFVFLFISMATFMLMCYARYLKQRTHKGGFYNPPPMIHRYPQKGKNGVYGSRSDYSTLQSRHIPSSLSHAASQQSEVL